MAHVKTLYECLTAPTLRLHHDESLHALRLDRLETVRSSLAEPIIFHTIYEDRNGDPASVCEYTAKFG